MRWFAFSLLLGVLVFSGCKSTVEEADLQRWTNNSEGLNRIEEIMRDPAKAGPEIRFRALEVMVEKGLAFEIPRMLQRAQDGKELASKLADKALSALKGGGEAAIRARDSLLMLVPHVPEERGDALRKAVADWAFEGLEADSPKDTIKGQIEARIRVAHIKKLGIHGVEGAGLLVRHGFALSEVANYLTRLKNDKARATLAKALIALHKDPKIDWTLDQVTMMRDAKAGFAFATMMALYQDPERDEDVQAMSFNAALAGAGSALKDKRYKPAALAALKKSLKADDVDDRWIAMNVLTEHLGDHGVDLSLAALDDKANLTNGSDDTAKSMVDYCGDVVAKHAPKSKQKVLALLSTGTLQQRALAVACAKTWRNKVLLDPLRKLVEEKSSPELPMVFSDVPNMAALAQNAIDGMAIMDEVDALEKAKKLSKKEADLRRFYATVLLGATGDALRKQVDEAVK
jgi:hypothetical protein